MRLLSLLVAVVLFLGSTQAIAGPNEGGTLILHANVGLTYTLDVTSYCGQSDVTDCAAAVDSVSGSDVFVFFAIAAFPAPSSPRLSAMTFGITYDDTEIFLLDQGSCGDFEIATENWPAPGEGTAITWDAAQTGRLTEVYWFAGYNAYGNPRSFDLQAHPTQGAEFADDAVPSTIDTIAELGRIGFDTPGLLLCPETETDGSGNESDDDQTEDSSEEGNGDGPDTPPEFETKTFTVFDTETGGPIPNLPVSIADRAHRFVCGDENCTVTCTPPPGIYIERTKHATTDSEGRATVRFDYPYCDWIGDDAFERIIHRGFNAPQITEDVTDDHGWILAYVEQDQEDTVYATSESYLAEKFSPVLHAHGGTLELQEGLGDVDETIANAKLDVYSLTQHMDGWDPIGDLHKWEGGDDPRYDSFAETHIQFYWILDIANPMLHSAGTSRPLYYHVYPFQDGAVIQYWYFFNANDTTEQWEGVGFHEGDWEHVSIYATWTETGWQPQSVNFYNHNGGQVLSASSCWWSDTAYPTYAALQQGANERNTHLHVWIAANSHASYNRYDYVYGLLVDAPVGGETCDFFIWDYVDYNIADNPDGNHQYFEYDELIRLGEYWTITDAHDTGWTSHNEGTLDFNRYVGNFGKGAEGCPSGCPNWVCVLAGAVGFNSRSMSPTAPLNDTSVHNWRAYHPGPFGDRWGNGTGSGASVHYIDYPLRGNYLGMFCRGGSHEDIEFVVPAQFQEPGKATITVTSGNVAFPDLDPCGNGCYTKTLEFTAGYYVFEQAAGTGSGSISITIHGEDHPNDLDADAFIADIMSDCSTSNAVSRTDEGQPRVLKVLPSVVGSGTVTIAFGAPSLGGDRVVIYDVAGRRIHAIECKAGETGIAWDAGKDKPLASGLYFAALERNGRTLAKDRLIISH